MSVALAAPAARQRPAGLVLLALLTVWVVWGSTYLGIKFALASFPPFLLMATRFLAAGALLFGWQTLVRRRPLPRWREWRDNGLLGVLLVGVGTGATGWAQQTVESGTTALFVGAAPLIAAVLTGFFGEWPRRRDWLAIALGSVGMVVLVRGKSFGASWEGAAVLLLGILSWQLGSVLARFRLKPAEDATGAACQMLVGGAFLLACAMLAGERMSAPPTPLALGAWVYLVVAGGVLAFTAYMYMLPRLPQPLATSYAYVNPVIAVALGVAFGGERLSPDELIAGAIVVASVAIFILGRR